jgi:hypothetical protein
MKILMDKTFQQAVEKKYMVASGNMMEAEDDVEQVLSGMGDGE